MRLIAGTAFGQRAPAAVYSPMFYLAATLEAGAVIELPVEHAERAAYLADGSIEVDGEQRDGGEMLVFESAATVAIRAISRSRVMLLGGAPLDGPRHVWWNFVSSDRERIEFAKIDWAEDRFAHVPGDPERIPLPER